MNKLSSVPTDSEWHPAFLLKKKSGDFAVSSELCDSYREDMTGEFMHIEWNFNHGQPKIRPLGESDWSEATVVDVDKFPTQSPHSSSD